MVNIYIFASVSECVCVCVCVCVCKYYTYIYITYSYIHIYIRILEYKHEIPRPFLQSGPTSDVSPETLTTRIPYHCITCTMSSSNHSESPLTSIFGGRFSWTHGHLETFTNDLAGPQIRIEVKRRKEWHVNCRFDGSTHVGDWKFCPTVLRILSDVQGIQSFWCP